MRDFMKTCNTCKYRNDFGVCKSLKITDDELWELDFLDATKEEIIEHDKKIKDMLLYSYDEGGSFFVGEDFGCVHHEEKLQE